MTRGKSVAQVCHAITGLWEKHQRGSKELVKLFILFSLSLLFFEENGR